LKKTLSNYYLVLVLVFIVIMIAFNIAMLHSSVYMFLDSSTKNIQNNIINNYKDELKNRVEIVEEYIEQKQKLVRQRLQKNLETKVSGAYKIAQSIYEKYKDTKSEKEIKNLIKTTLREIRFNNKRGYFFIDDIKGNCVLYPIRPTLEGQNIIEIQDINKKYVVRDFIRIALEESQGFYSYFTYRYKYAKGKNHFEKISFVKLFKPYNWIIGTGEYLVDVQNDLKQEVAKIVNTIKIANNTSYIQIYEIHNFKGGKEFATMVANANRADLLGKKISSQVTDNAGKKYRQEMLDAINNYGEGYVTYQYKKLDSDVVAKKLTYVKKIPHWNWVLATGIYLDKLDSIVAENTQKLVDIQEKNHKMTLIFFSLLFLVAIGISLIISRKISFESGKIREFFKRAAFRKEHIDVNNLKIIEFKSLAFYANKMVQAIHKEQEKLEGLNSQLELNIQQKTIELKSLNTYLQEKNEELEKHYYTDSLTKLSNRNKFVDDLNSCEHMTVVIFDIDDFKNINDFYGTKVGDDLLISLGIVLEDFAKENKAFAYRLSSDEFLICFENFDLEQITLTCQDFIHKLSQMNFYDESQKIRLSISMTFAIATGSENILEKSDLALNYAKTHNLAYAIFNEENPHMNIYKHKMYWREKIQWAIDNDLIEPFFQPIVNTKNFKERKYEALMRIVDEDEVISPYMFLEIAKETKQYSILSRMMMQKSFQKFEGCTCEFSINIAMEDITNQETKQALKELILKYKIGHRLILEILETEDIISNEEFMPFVEEMRSFGVRFAIDDFGSGYSNFGVLVKMSPKFLKIDGDLVKEIHRNKKSYHIVNTIVNFADHIGATVIAEFVENETLAHMLSAMGVKYMQGYHFAPPAKELDW
jgi:c-di-GMP phosphodiesterase